MHRELVNSPKGAGERSVGAPGVQQLSVQVVLQKLVGHAINDPQMMIGRHHNVERRTDMIPFAEILPVLVENLDAAVRPIRDVDPAVRVDVDRVRQAELAGSPSLLSPPPQALSSL